MLLAGTPWRSAIGKILLAGGAVPELLLAGAPWRSAIGKMLLAGGAVTELLLAGGAVAEKFTPDEVCCWQGSRLGDP